MVHSCCVNSRSCVIFILVTLGAKSDLVVVIGQVSGLWWDSVWIYLLKVNPKRALPITSSMNHTSSSLWSSFLHVNWTRFVSRRGEQGNIRHHALDFRTMDRPSALVTLSANLLSSIIALVDLIDYTYPYPLKKINWLFDELRLILDLDEVCQLIHVVFCNCNCRVFFRWRDAYWQTQVASKINHLSRSSTVNNNKIHWENKIERQ